ncbi:uncharacterized protein LOC143468725 [Clavelina lepadiformis]|uniref:uncharacterized protein LOC143468725 n=1 Tax=Clavelina lepadiformis TaxID=159417 RepID=UPI00404260A9
MHLKSPGEKHSYTAEELQHLVAALGYPKEIFKKNLPSTVYENDKVSTKDLLHYCDLRYFHQDLHFTINLKSSSYNAEILKKSILLVSKRLLSFKELENVRLAYEAYEEFDQRGMKLCERTLLRSLKLCQRVISPQKLANKLRHVRSTFKEKHRIQLYEFLDLIVLCDSVPDDSDGNEVKPLDKTWRDVYQVENFSKFVIPNDKKLWKILNEQYRNEELQYGRPTLVSQKFVEDPLIADDFHKQVKLSNKGFLALQRKLKESDKQIKLSRGGFTNTKPRPKSTISASTTRSKPTKFSESNGSALSWSKMIQRGTMTRLSPTATTVTGFPSHRSAPVGGNVKRMMAKRPLSCPPVVDKHTQDETKNKFNDLKFQMETKKQRWSDRFVSEISQYLPEYKEVLRRMVEEPGPPGKRNRRRLVRARPSPGVLSRLAQPKPMLPRNHVTHCDATRLGFGDDPHATQLQRHALEVKRAIEEERRRLKRDQVGWNAFSGSNANLFQRLLCDIDEESLSEKNEETDDDDAPEEKSLNKVDDADTEDKDDVIKEVEVVDDAEKRRLAVLEYFSKPRDRVGEVMQLMTKGYDRIFIRLDDDVYTESTKKLDESLPRLSRDSSAEDFSQPLNPVKSQANDVTEFEKFVENPANLTVPDDVFRSRSNKSIADLRRIRKSYERFSARLENIEAKSILSLAKFS